MNKSESKYFSTAVKMDQAFLTLLEKKDLSYITVKEICSAAGVNRSTFYLHYETITDLLNESVEYMNQKFIEYMNLNTENFMSKIHTCSKEELLLVTPKYLHPYLSYIKEYKWLFKTATKNSNVLGLHNTYNRMNQYVFTPILERYNIPKQDQEYMVPFYIQGIMAIILKWLEKDCEDSIEFIIEIIQKCVEVR